MELKPSYIPHAAQEEFHKDKHRFRVISAGRRWGKSLSGIFELWRLLQACKDPRPRGWIVSPTYPLAYEDWRICLQLMGPAIVERNVNSMRLEVLCNPTPTESKVCEIELKSAERGDEGLRGAGLNAVLMDECAMISELAWSYGIRPALADKRGKGIFISTPRRQNWFYEIFHQGMGDDPEWKSFQFPSNSNPHFPPEEWAQLERVTPKDLWRQEYLAEFLESDGAVFHGLEQIASGMPTAPQDSRSYAIGVDLARKLDFTAIVVLDDTGQVVYQHRGKELEWSLQRKMIEGVWKRYQPGVVYIDSAGMGDVIEGDLRNMQVSVRGVNTQSGIIKTELIENLIVVIENSRIAIPNEREWPEFRWVWDELRMYERTETASHHYNYSAPEGKHDDGVIALGLACWGMRSRLAMQRVIRESKSGWSTWGEYRQASQTPVRNYGGFRVRQGLMVRPW